MFKRSIKSVFKVEQCLVVKDNVLGFKFVNIATKNELVVYCVYLPPEGSKYSGDNDQVLNLLTIDIYKQNEASPIIVCGDFNARIGAKNDIIIGVDNICDRISLDKTSNSQGDQLITMINDVKGCVLNGRVTPEYDDFTSIASHKGRAVVDYFITRQCDIEAMKSLEVHSMTNLIDKLNIQSLLGE